MSGTNARPFFELVGTRGSSGIMQPLGTERSFKPGRVDIFTYPQVGGGASVSPWAGVWLLLLAPPLSATC